MNRRAFLQTAAATAVAATLPAPILFAEPGTPDGQTGWWMTEPIRWLQTNLRETNAALNPGEFIADVANFKDIADPDRAFELKNEAGHKVRHDAL